MEAIPTIPDRDSEQISIILLTATILTAVDDDGVSTDCKTDSDHSDDSDESVLVGDDEGMREGVSVGGGDDGGCKLIGMLLWKE